MERKEFINQIIEKSNQSIILSTYITVVDENLPLSSTIIEILSLNKNRISKEGQHIIDTLENDSEFPFSEQYKELKLKILSLVNIQDIFPGTIYDGYKLDSFYGQYYFYYEGLHLLREFFYCGFNNFLAAGDSLMRTFIEFNLMQCYYIERCRRENSFDSIRNYMNTGISPSSLKMINYYFPSDSFCKPIKKKIQVILKGLSQSSSHAFSPKDSIRGNGKMNHEYSMDSLLFWVSLKSMINSVLWSYYIIFPMLFNPKNIIQKFGFSPPLGIFITEDQYKIIKKTLSKEDFLSFNQYLHEKTEIEGLDEWYDSLPNKSDNEIIETWVEDNELDSFEQGWVLVMVKLRAMREMLANKAAMDFYNKTDSKYEKLIDNIDKYSFWKRNYKSM